MCEVIRVWRPPFEVPSSLTDCAARKNAAHYRRLPEFEGVVLERLLVGGSGFDALLCADHCPEHDDAHIDEAWTLLWVVRNDKGSFVQARGVYPIRYQPVGTAILLNIHHRHSLGSPWNPGEDPLKDGVGLWVGVYENFARKPSVRRCEAYLRGVRKKVVSRG